MPAEQLPDIELTDEMEREITEYLQRQIREAVKDRKQDEELWAEIQTMYEEYELEDKKDFPFEGAAHLMLPIIAMYSERMQSRLHRTVWRPRYPLSVGTKRKEFESAITPTRDYVDWMVREELDLPQLTNGMFMELAKLGSMVSKTIFEKKNEIVHEWDEMEEDYVPIPKKVHDGPRVVHIPLADFLWPQHARSLDEAEWKAHRVRLHWNEVKRREFVGKFKDVDRIKGQHATESEYEQALSAARGKSPDLRDHYEVWEIWFEYATDDSGIAKKLVAWYHLDSDTLLRIQHNWYPMQGDPFDLCPYVVKEHRVTGLGVGEMAMPFQKEVSIMHDQRLDNATISNIVGYKYKLNSVVGGNITMTPGEGVPVDEMDDFDSFQWGQKYDSTANEEKMTMEYLRERIGIPQLNMEDQINATNFMSIIQESAGKADQIVDNIRRWLSRVIEKCLMLTAKYYPAGRGFSVLGPDGKIVDSVFDLEPETIRRGLVVSVTATKSINSQELERQGKLSVFNLLTQYYGQLSQYFIQANSPEVPPPVRTAMLEIVRGLGQFVLEVLDDFNIRNRDQLAININRIMQLSAQQEAAGPTPGSPASPGMANPQGAGAQGGQQAGQGAQGG